MDLLENSSAVAFVAMGSQSLFLELAATEMTNNLKKQWFEALLRQDMAYYDLRDVGGTSTIISTNGQKFKRYQFIRVEKIMIRTRSIVTCVLTLCFSSFYQRCREKALRRNAIHLDCYSGFGLWILVFLGGLFVATGDCSFYGSQ